MSRTIELLQEQVSPFSFTLDNFRSRLPDRSGTYVMLRETVSPGLLGGGLYDLCYVGISDGRTTTLNSRAGTGVGNHENYRDFLGAGVTHVAFFVTDGLLALSTSAADLERRIYDAYHPPLNKVRPVGDVAQRPMGGLASMMAAPVSQGLPPQRRSLLAPRR